MGFMTSSHIPSDNPLYHDTLELLIALVQNACVNDFTPGSGQEVRNADTLTEFFADTLGINIQRFEPEPGRASLVVTVPGTNPQAARAMLCGSMPMNADTSAILDSFGLVASPKTGVRGDYLIERAFVEQ